MKTSDALKVFVMLMVATLVATAIVYANVNLGMSWEQMIAKVEGWNSSLDRATLIVWSVAVTLYIANRIR